MDTLSTVLYRLWIPVREIKNKSYIHLGNNRLVQIAPPLYKSSTNGGLSKGICFEGPDMLMQGLNLAGNSVLNEFRYRWPIDGYLSTLESLWVVDAWHIKFSEICIIPDTKMLHA